VSKHRRTDDDHLDTAIKGLLNTLDYCLSAAARRLRQLDEDTYNLMRVSHYRIAKRAMKEASMATSTYANKLRDWFLADPDRRRTSSYRNRGLGTMLAVSTSTGGGTNFHYDEGDDGEFPLACNHACTY
jgi:hypothetical protein